MERPLVADGGNGLHIWRAAANILNKPVVESRQRVVPSVGVGWGDNNSSAYYETLLKASELDQWRVLMNTVMNLWVPYDTENITSYATISFCCIELVSLKYNSV
jgi:hypothetical protein